MPELPEVETVKEVLKQHLVHKTIESIDVFYPGIIKDPIDEFLKNTLNKTIIDIKRYGKYLIFELNKGYLLSHLRMEGKYYYLENSFMEDKHIHVVFHFKDNSTLYYKDVRKFGRMKLINKESFNDYFVNIGEDANNVNDINKIYNNIHKSSNMIKTILLDQSIISGIGNIYADEILFDSKISPFKKGKEITKEELENILKSSKKILNEAIKYNGTTIKSFTSAYHQKGSYQNYLMVHTKNKCSICNSNIIKTKINGRSTYYCEVCQKVQK